MRGTRRSQCHLAIAATAALTCVGTADAATWANTATDFNAGTSWVAGTAPTEADGASFSGAAVTQPQLSASITTTAVSFDATAGGYNLTSADASHKLTLTATPAINSAFASGLNTIDADVVLGRTGTTTQAFTQAGGGTLRVTGDISETGGAKTLTLTRSLGTPIYELSGNNTYTGGTTYVNSSVRLHVGSSTALGSGPLNAPNNSGATDNVSGGALTLANALNLTSASGNGLVFHNTSNLNFSGAVTLNGGPATGLIGAQQLNIVTGTTSLGAIGEAAAGKGISKTGAGTLVLGGTNSYTGNTYVSAGTLILDGSSVHAGVTTISSTGTLLVNGSHTGGGAYSVANGAKLGGAGSITTNNANVSLVSATKLIPGASAGAAGTLTLALGTGVLDLSGMIGSSAGGLVFDLGSIAASDRITLTTGSLNIGTGVMNFTDLNLTALAGLESGDYTLIETGNVITGSLAATGLTGAVGSATGTLKLSSDNKKLLLTVEAIPEPGSAGLVVGATGLFLAARRRKRP